jgi:hypothetical protein
MPVAHLFLKILIVDWDYTALLKAFGGKKSSSFRVKTKREMNELFSQKDFATGEEIQLVDVIMPVMDAPRALQEQARLLEMANRKSEHEAEADKEGPPSKKRKQASSDMANSTTSGIGFHGLTNGAESLSV